VGKGVLASKEASRADQHRMGRAGGEGLALLSLGKAPAWYTPLPQIAALCRAEWESLTRRLPRLQARSGFLRAFSPCCAKENKWSKLSLCGGETEKTGWEALVLFGDNCKKADYVPVVSGDMAVSEWQAQGHLNCPEAATHL